MELPFISEFKSEKRVFLFVYLLDVFIIIAFWIIGILFKSAVHSKLQTIFIIYNIAIGIILTRKSKTNPKKRIYSAMMIMLSKDKTLYKPVFAPRNTLGKE